jgi:hypothetical protein
MSETNPLGKEFGKVEHKDSKGEVMWIPLYDEDLENECDPRAGRDQEKEKRREQKKISQEDFGDFEEEEIVEGDQFLCVR